METLKRSEILRSRRDVARVMREGRRVPGDRLYLRWRQRVDAGLSADNAPSRRIAFLLSRRVGNSVQRNRLKRRLRELYRRNKRLLPERRDYLVFASAGSGELGFAELARQFADTCRVLRHKGLPG